MPEPRPPRSNSQSVAASSAWSMEKNSKTPAAPKLRDSCHNCAASKQRCSKEKPACVRCLKRGKTCEYQQSKRAGRARADTRGGRPQDSNSRQGKDANFIAVSFVSNHPSPAVPAPTSTETPVGGTAPLDVASPASRTGDMIYAAGWVPTPTSPDAVPTSISSDTTGAEMNHLCFPSHDMQDMFGRSSETASVGGEAITDSTGDDDPWSIASIGDFTGAGRLDPDLYSSIFMAPFSDVGSPVVDMNDVAKTSISHQPFSLSLFPPQPQHQLQPQQTPPPAPPPPPSRTASSGTGSSANLTRAGSLSSMSLLPGTDGGSGTSSSTSSSSVDPTRTGSSSLVSVFPGTDCTNRSVSSQQRSCSCLTRAIALLQQQLARSSTNCAGVCSSSSSSSSSINAAASATTQSISSGSASPSSLHPQPQPELRPAPPTAPTVSTVLVQNERTIEAVSGILQCRACGHDRYLLTTLALVIFKLLGWYAAAARNAQQREAEAGTGIGAGEGEGDHHHHYQMECVLALGDSGFGFGEGLAMDGAGIQRLEFEEEEDPGRMVPQLVLSKLYRVKRLVNDLSERLRTSPGRGSSVGSGSSSSSSSSSTVHSLASAGGRSVSPGGFGMATSSTLDDGLVNASLSTALLNQIELDLRRRLRALSTEVIDMLRRG
ncbi:hypothetical protein C7999DRAFT_34691 [Corynascus novoguineensis]|uniref:Zn(2)-C6 fungal-type domain-containing protein n=1 Tax=Corynascus novoguineensis TaxID=1126955 RepID=A0AAN7CMT7_9PEZI|nr:hypothetical protein C7999DRAFT_34691 [Corynascus novoguineensis]